MQTTHLYETTARTQYGQYEYRVRTSASTTMRERTYLLSETTAVLLRHALCHRHGGHTTWLCAANLAARRITTLGHVLRDLCGFTATRFSDNNQQLIVMNRLCKQTNKL